MNKHDRKMWKIAALMFAYGASLCTVEAALAAKTYTIGMPTVGKWVGCLTYEDMNEVALVDEANGMEGPGGAAELFKIKMAERKCLFISEPYPMMPQQVEREYKNPEGVTVYVLRLGTVQEPISNLWVMTRWEIIGYKKP